MRIVSLHIAQLAGRSAIIHINSGGAAPLAIAERLGLLPCCAGPTYPSSTPTLRLDWAFTTPRIRVRSVMSLSHLPSDHCALRLDVELP